MIKNIFKILGLAVLSVVLAFVVMLRIDQTDIVIEGTKAQHQIEEPATTPSPSPTPEIITIVRTPEPTPSPTPEPTPEPQPEYFTLSFIGDCTLAPHQNTQDFRTVMNGDYSYPFKNTASFFQADDLTIANLECTLSSTTRWSSQQFYFQSPPEYAQILVEGSVELVTTANNHTDDFGSDAISDTKAALEQYGIAYAGNDAYTIVETPTGLKVGMYACTYSHITEKRILDGIAALKAAGAEFIVLALHWGQELIYSPSENQISWAHTAIDNGANVIYGSHPHCLGPVEEYNGGLILYSMGNWSFGGSTNPSDPDTAIVQVNVKRDLDGTLTTEGYNAIPCCISSRISDATSHVYGYNDYCPTPYEEGTEDYARVMSKITGTFEGGNQGADYSNWYSSFG